MILFWRETKVWRTGRPGTRSETLWEYLKRRRRYRRAMAFVRAKEDAALSGLGRAFRECVDDREVKAGDVLVDQVTGDKGIVEPFDNKPNTVSVDFDFPQGLEPIDEPPAQREDRGRHAEA